METRPTAEHQRIAFGEFLRQARERRRLTLEQIAGETKIAPRLLTSLEQGNVQPMPKGMYRRAMLRAYAESVGLDTQAALTEFERTFEEPPPREVPVPTVPQPAVTQAGPRAMAPRRPIVLAAAAIGVVAALGIGLWALLPGSSPSPAAPSRVTSSAISPPTPAPLPQATSASRVPGGATAPAAAVRKTPPPPVVAASRPAAPSGGTATSGRHEVARKAEPASQAPAAPLATEGRLVVASEPAGARVTVNGVGWGQTPLTIDYLPLGEKRVRVTKAGYLSEERTVRLDGRRANATVRVTLRERP